MSRFLKCPQLPEDYVTTLAIGEKYASDYLGKLEQLGIEVITINGPMELDPRLRSHADLLLLHQGGERFLAASGLNTHNYLSVYDYVNLSSSEAALNICIVGQFWIGCPYYAAWRPMQMKQIVIKQRYTRCSTCIVDDHSIITADHGIAQAAAACHMDVLEITPGYIYLNGFNYGFIGGASFKLSLNKLAFTGKLSCHPDEKRILEFLEDHCVEAVYLSDGPLQDIGSAVLLKEKC